MGSTLSAFGSLQLFLNGCQILTCSCVRASYCFCIHLYSLPERSSKTDADAENNGSVCKTGVNAHLYEPLDSADLMCDLATSLVLLPTVLLTGGYYMKEQNSVSINVEKGVSRYPHISGSALLFF